MKPEELLKTLRDGGMDDETIKQLLSDTLASLEGPAEEPAPEQQPANEEDERAQAGKLLGVAL